MNKIELYSGGNHIGTGFMQGSIYVSLEGDQFESLQDMYSAFLRSFLGKRYQSRDAPASESHQDLPE